MIHIELLGSQALQDKFAALPAKVERKILKDAMKEAGELVLADAIFNAPIDSGALVASLIVKAFSRRGRIGVKIGVNNGDIYYASFNELGTDKEPARPFLRPALDNNSDRAIEIITKNLQEALK